MAKQISMTDEERADVIRNASKSYRASNKELTPYNPSASRPPEPVPEPVPEEMPALEPMEQPPQEATTPPAVETQPVKEKEPPREENKRRRNKPQPEAEPDYKTLFLHEAMITARSGKTVYICQQHHNRILKILQVIGKNEVSLFAYIYNVLEHHFAEFQDDITELYESNIEKIF
jgi:hypothetical protein